MKNIVNKIKNVSAVSLLGLAVAFNLASCGCGEKSATSKLAATIIPETKGGEPIKVNVKAAGGEAAKLEEVKVSISDIVGYSDEFKTPVSDNEKAKIKVNEDGKDLAELIKVKSLAKDDSKDFNLTVELNGSTATHVKFKVNIMRGSDAIVGAKDVEVKWHKTK